MGLVAFCASFVIWASLEYSTRVFEASEQEVVVDTVYIEVVKEVVKEVQVEVQRPVVVPIQKPSVQQKIEEIKQDSVSADI
jgi:hypothetical protein